MRAPFGHWASWPFSPNPVRVSWGMSGLFGVDVTFKIPRQLQGFFDVDHYADNPICR